MTTEFDHNGNPFPGLRPFETDEYQLFFGREGQSDELLARLGRTRFLAVVGTSGSGKSSLIRAGLLPALYGGLMAQTGSAWRIALLRPGGDPIGHLACALAAPDVLGNGEQDGEVQAAVIEATLRRSTLGLVDALKQARLAAYENLLVVVDQFEELFRFRAARGHEGTDDDAAAFVKLLLEAGAQRDVPLYVVLTMRSDFLGDCAQFWGLPEAINTGQYLIPRMTRDERRSAITGPVAVGGGEISQPLVNRLLNDVGDNPDHLPILQHALMRTWDFWTTHRRDAEPLGLEHYDAIGGMTNALSRHADEAWDELPDERSRLIAELLFKALTERGVDNREIRRPTRVEEICNIAGATREEVAAVVEVFRLEGRSFLMPPSGVELSDETVIDISHESLIRNWQRLKEWVKDEAEAARIYRRLAGAASDYREGTGGLLDDVTLRWVLKWRDKYRPSRAWGVRYHPEFDAAIAYLEESRAAREAEAAERERQRQDFLERERRELETARSFAEQQARAARRLRALVSALTVMFGLAIVAVVFALFMEKRAEAARQKLQKSRTALTLIQGYEMEKAEKELNELYMLTANDEEGHENRAWVLYNLGELNQRLERHDQAAAFFESALQAEEMIHTRLGIDSVGTLDSLAHTLEAEGSYDAAVARFEQLSDILGGVADRKGKYFRLNAANVCVDLAKLYIKRASVLNPPASAAAATPGGAESGASPQKSDETFADARKKARIQYERALAIWEEVLGDDPEALGGKYEEASGFFFRELGDRQTSSVLYAKSIDAFKRVGTPLTRKPIGPPNAGNDPGINAQLPPEGPGYSIFNNDTAHVYGRPATIEFVRNVAAAMVARRPGIKLIIGDISLRGGGPFPPHGLDHQDGREVDIWPVTNNGVAEPTNIYAPNYSRDLTTELIKLIRQTNPNAVVYFDDPPLITAGLVQGTLDHNNYMHVLLP
jgi:tetratricopeptide (TPR) repeat protein/energy-coupling factor transporter ATP-binding protein EcfA2